MLSHQDMSDRLEIQDLLTKYCFAIDSREWDALDDVFTPDAIIDYTEVGGARGNLQETKAYLDRALAKFTGFQHMIGLPMLTINGDNASARTIVYNPMIIEKDGAPHTFFVGVWYRDKLVRTAKGWRIVDRHEEMSYFHNFPQDFTPVDV